MQSLVYIQYFYFKQHLGKPQKSCGNFLIEELLLWGVILIVKASKYQSEASELSALLEWKDQETQHTLSPTSNASINCPVPRKRVCLTGLVYYYTRFQQHYKYHRTYGRKKLTIHGEWRKKLNVHSEFIFP